MPKTLCRIEMDAPPRTPLKTEVLWFFGVLLLAVASGVVGLIVFVGRLQAL